MEGERVQRHIILKDVWGQIYKEGRGSKEALIKGGARRSVNMCRKERE